MRFLLKYLTFSKQKTIYFITILKKETLSKQIHNDFENKNIY